MVKERLFYMLVAGFSLLACSDPGHKIFIPEGKNFSIVMPCKPKTQRESSTFKDYIVQSSLYRCNGPGYVYIVTYSEYPLDIYKEYSAQELMAEVVKHIEYADPPLEFISKKPLNIAGIKGVEIRSRILSPRALYKSVIFYAGDGIYQVTYSAKKGLFDSPRADAFFASIRFTRQ